MAHSTMSLPALYNYAKSVENIDVFEFLTVPTNIDRSTLVNLLLMRSAPFECVYPDPEYLKAAIGTWSAVHNRTFTKWANALDISYDPLYNYDRTEEESASGLESRTKKHSQRLNDTESESNDTESLRKGSQNNATIGSTKDANSTTGDTTNSVSAFDSANWSNSDKSATSGSSAGTGSNMTAITGTDSEENTIQNDRVASRTADTSNNENENAIDSRSRKLRAYGNIGVTTSQQMLESELDISAWNLYEHIADLFLDEFCVLLY